MRAANFPVFAANLRRPDGTPVPGTSESTILTIGGIKLGVVGIAAGIPARSQARQLAGTDLPTQVGVGEIGGEQLGTVENSEIHAIFDGPRADQVP